MSNLASLFVLLLFGGSTAAFYTDDGPVTVLTPDNFKTNVAKGSLWLVEFYAPWCGHCKNLKNDWEKAARALKGIVNVGAVDADAHKELGAQYKVTGYPTIKMFSPGSSGWPTVSDYSGGRTATDIVTFALAEAKKVALSRLGVAPEGDGGSRGGGGQAGGGSCGGPPGGGGGHAGGAGFYGANSAVVSLSDANFQETVLDSDDLFFVEFYAPWCGHCKALAPAFDSVATMMKGKVKVGAVDCTTNAATCQSYGVRGYPTLKFFGISKSDPADYNGGRDADSMAAYLNSEWSQMAPPPEVHELTDQDSIEISCLGTPDMPEGLERATPKSWCFIAFLPHVLDSGVDGRSAYIQVLRSAAESFKDRPYGYMWSAGTQQTALEANFEVGGFGYPALVAYNPAHQRYATLKGAYDSSGVVTFIKNLQKGYEKTIPIQGSLAEAVTVTPWDGTEGSLEEEDEFSLEDLLNEEL